MIKVAKAEKYLFDCQSCDREDHSLIGITLAIKHRETHEASMTVAICADCARELITKLQKHVNGADK